jgi:hypothetical protein
VEQNILRAQFIEHNVKRLGRLQVPWSRFSIRTVTAEEFFVKGAYFPASDIEIISELK